MNDIKQVVSQAIALIPVLLLHGVAGYMALAVFILMSLNISATNVASKTRALEQRMANIEGVTYPNTGGLVNGNIISGGDTQVNGNIYGSGGGTLHNSSSFHSAGTVQADSQMLTPSINVNSSGSGAAVGVNGSVHASGTGQFDSGVSASNFSGSYSGSQGGTAGYPIAHGTPWEDQIIDFLNSMEGKLRNAGVF